MESSWHQHQSTHNKLQAEFIALAINKVGDGIFKDCQSEEFEDLQQKSPEEFYLEEDEAQDVKGIKNAEFNKFINLGYEKTTTKATKKLDQLAVKGYKFVYGFNDAHRTVEIIEERLCRAIGVNIFFEGRVYPSQADRNDQLGHSHSICYINYDDSSKMLYSGSSGKSSEIIQWNYNQSQRTLCYLRKVVLPSSALGVAFTFKINDSLFCITKWSLHQQSQLFSFDSASRRTRCEVILGKVVAFCEALDVFLVNQKGLHMLVEGEKGLQTIKISQSEQLATALGRIGSEYLLVGLMDGSVQFISLKTKLIVTRITVTHGAILSIKMVDKFRFAVTTSHKQLTIFETDHKLNGEKTLATFELDDVARNVLINESGFICCLKGGKVETYVQIEGKIEKKIDLIEEAFNMGASQQLICYNKAVNKYFYSSKGKKFVTVFQLSPQGTISKANNIDLTHPISLFDSHSTTLACIEEPPISISTSTNVSMDKKATQILQFYDFISQKTLFVIHELPFGGCTFLKFNPDGDKLALGFSNGAIVVLNNNVWKETRQICRSQIEKIQGLNHTTPIENIIWSADGHFLKTLSHRNLLFYGLVKKNDDNYELILHDGKKTVQKEALKTAVLKAEWTQMGKFNWRNSKIWSRANSVQEYVEIIESKEYLLACLEDGKMEAYQNPAAEEFHLLCRWFTGPYICKLVEQREQGIILLLVGGGVLASVIIG